MYGLKQCYDNGAIRSAYASIKEYSGGASLYEKNAVKNIPLPNGSAFNSSSKTAADCKALIQGSGKLQSAYAFMGHPAPASGSQDVGTFLKTYAGYTEKSGSAAQNGRCVFFKFQHTSVAPGGKTTTEDVKTNKICFEKLENDVIKSSPTIVEHEDGSGGWRAVEKTGGYMGYKVSTPALKIGGGGVIEISGTPGAKIKTAGRKINDVISEFAEKWESTDLNWNEDCKSSASNLGNSCTKHSTTYEGSETPPADSLDAATASYSNPDGNKAIRNLMGCEEGKEDTCIGITREERVRVYMNYLTSVLGAKVMCNLSQEQISGNSYDGPIKWFESGKTTLTQNCYVQPSNTTTQLNGIGNGHFQYQSINYNGLIEFFKNPDITELSEPSDGGETQPDEAVNNLDGADASGKEPSCYDKTGALGWVLCPVTIAAGEFVEAFYGSMIQPFLQIDVGLFTDSNQTLFGVWQIFQGFANIAFVALFLFVIFSQITGYGIDNYGIKKTLPRLILGAIMINASFLICQLAVEVSNILGIGIRSLFEGIQVGISDIAVRGTSGSASTVGTIASVSLGAGGLAIVVAIIAVLIKNAVLALDRIVISVLLTIIVVIVALIFLFVVLSLRYALAILLVLVSPLAFVCYMLPNTKKVFDRWLSMFKGLLLAYPIVSALVFGGEFIGKLLLASQPAGAGHPVVLLLAVAIMAIAPVFMIPTVLMKSLGALSGVAERMRGYANKLSSSAGKATQHAVNRSGFSMTQQARAAERNRLKTLSRTQSAMRRLEAKKARQGGELSKYDQEALRKHRASIASSEAQNRRRDQEAFDDRKLTFAERFSNMSPGDILSLADDFNSNFVDQYGNIDMAAIVAAGDTLPDADQKYIFTKKLLEYDTFTNHLKGNAEDRGRIAQMATKDDNRSLANFALAKQIRKISADKNAEQPNVLFSDASMADKIAGIGTAAMANADKDMYKIPGISDKLSNEQITTGLASGYSGSTASEFNNMLSSIDDGRRMQISRNMGTDAMGGLTADSLTALTGIDASQTDASGNYTQDQIDAFRSHFDEATLARLSQPSGSEALSNMSPQVIRALGLNVVQPSSQNASASQTDATVLNVREATQASTNPSPTSANPANANGQNQPPQPPRDPDDAAPTS
ncbi:hypothetical protein IJ102_00745 [Candidatus Saccharibacteria bacterium]|nr:hypothetical protein [Candidatus Saccharibacteria bacterium]